MPTGLIELATAPEPFAHSAETLDPPAQAEPSGEPPLASTSAVGAPKTAPVDLVLLVLATIAFPFCARTVVLSVLLACVAGMALKQLIRWLSLCRIPPGLSAAVVLCFLVFALGIGLLQLSRPAMTWLNEAPRHMNESRQRFQKLVPGAGRFSQAAVAVDNLGATADEQKRSPTVELGTNCFPDMYNWTGTFVVCLTEKLVLPYLLLPPGDLFLQELVRVIPTFREKKRVRPRCDLQSLAPPN